MGNDKQHHLSRDGTSQEDRYNAALDPTHVLADERSIQKMLAQAKTIAEKLDFKQVIDGAVRSGGKWGSFFEGVDYDRAAAYLEHPEQFSEAEAEVYGRPHFALFLTFLKLLQQSREHINGLTKRHLDFYYRDVLGIEKKAAVPDHVNVLIDLAAGVDEVELPAGTQLNAGPDQDGVERFYQTDRTIVVNKAQVVALRTVHIENTVINLETVWPDDQDTFASFLAMLQLPLGSPEPGDPVYFSYEEQALQGGETRIARITLDTDSLTALHNLMESIGTKLFLDRRETTGSASETLERSNFSDFRELVELKLNRDKNDDADWDAINQHLQTIAPKQHDHTEFVLNITDKRDFESNFLNAFNQTEMDEFGGEIPQIDSVLDLTLQLRHLEEIKEGFKQKYDNLDWDEFVKMLARRDEVMRDWDRIEEILKGAQSRSGWTDPFPPLKGADPFGAMLKAAVGDIDFADLGTVSGLNPMPFLRLRTINDVYEKLNQIEAQFYMSAEEFADITRIGIAQNSLGAPDRQQFVYSTLTDAYQRRIEAEARADGIELPADRLFLPQKREWANLHASAEAKTQIVSLGLEGEDETPRWHTFGQAQPSDDRQNRPPAALGWAISSPLLHLTGGTRIITLTMTCNPVGFDSDDLGKLLSVDEENGVDEWPFTVQLSGEKEWITLLQADIKPTVLEGSQLQIKVTVPADLPPIIPFADDEIGIATSVPTLKLMLNPIWDESNEDGKYVTHYRAFRELVATNIDLNINVEGLVPSLLQNDERKLKAGKPFEPFGQTAPSGAKLKIGHEEFEGKSLDSVKFSVEWMGVPNSDLNTHYRNYATGSRFSNSNFKVFIRPNKQVPARNDTQYAIFKGSDAHDPHDITWPGADGKPVSHEISYFEWELAGLDFQHARYPSLIVEKTAELARELSKPSPGSIDAYKINPPYTPKIQTLTIGYTVSDRFDIASYTAGQSATQIYHVEPFGFREIGPDSKFMPQYRDEGELYIGLENLAPPQNLSLLFQMAEGSADPDLRSQPVRWERLNQNRWEPLNEGDLLDDETRGLINSGIVSFALKSVEPSTLLPANLYWIRARIEKNVRSVADLVDIHPQSVSAVFVDQNNSPTHFGEPLPPDSISDLAQRRAAIKGVRQPYTSFGGKMGEADRFFYRRNSERLRHKDRAVSMWDYERLVLERFPEIYKAKCLPATAQKPGQVALIVIPDIRNKRPFNPFEPKAPINLIKDIEAYLAGVKPDTARLEVKNPEYSQVKVKVWVELNADYNEGFYFKQLNIALRRFLSPWAYDNQSEIEIGGRIYANAIINLLEEQPSVDYVGGIELWQDGEQIVAPPSENVASEAELFDSGYWVESSKPDEILVSAAEHEIVHVSTLEAVQESNEGIGTPSMRIDFHIRDEAFEVGKVPKEDGEQQV